MQRETRPYRSVVALLTVLSVLVTVFSLSFAYLVRYLINSASSGNERLLLAFSLVLLAVLFLKISLKTAESFLAERARAKMYTSLRTKTFSKILRSEYAGVQGYHSGELTTRLTSDVQEICVDTVGLTPTLVGMVVQCLGAIAALLTIDPIFTLIYVVCGCILGGCTALFRKQIKKRHKEVLEADEKARSFIQEGLSSVMSVKAYGGEEAAKRKADSLSRTYYDKRMKRNLLRSEMQFIFSLLSNFGLIFAVVWCSISVLNGNDDYGSILSVILLLMQLQQPLTSFSSVLPVYYSRAASAERLAEIDALPLEDIGAEGTRADELYGDVKEIKLNNVGFSYGREQIFERVDVQIPKGEIVCLTGASGSGKSTLFKLLLNVFQPTEGRILLALNGNEERLLTARERGLFAYVPQGNFLFSGTIYENLTFFMGDRLPSMEEIEHALRVACAEFVFELPEGLNTKLMEDGEGLSEGQQQRLNVARAILSDRPVLLLDEATSALDGDTEKRLLENVKALQNKTCLIVTHRPAALEVADRVLCLENGKLKKVRN